MTGSRCRQRPGWRRCRCRRSTARSAWPGHRPSTRCMSPAVPSAGTPAKGTWRQTARTGRRGCRQRCRRSRNKGRKHASAGRDPRPGDSRSRSTRTRVWRSRRRRWSRAVKPSGAVSCGPQSIRKVSCLIQEASLHAGPASSTDCPEEWQRHHPPCNGRPATGEVMSMRIGDTAPDFEAETTEGPIRFHDWIGDSWAVLFSHPKDFTPVCTTELGYMAKIKPEFDRRNVKIIGLSVDPIDKHEKWADDIEETQGTRPNYPIIGDSDFQVSKLYEMLPASASGDPSKRTPADNQTVRNVFVIGPDKKIKLILVYPMTTGRNFDEVLRVIDSLQLTASTALPRRSTGSRGRT